MHQEGPANGDKPTFSSTSISAYVFPSYSKIGSHPTHNHTKSRPTISLPAQNACIIPPLHTERTRPPRRHNLPQCPPLKEQRLLPRPGRVSERADGFSRFISVGGEQVVEARVAERGEEPFSVGGSLSMVWHGMPRDLCESSVSLA